MRIIDLVKTVDLKPTIRARQVMSMFDVPVTEKLSKSWKINVPIDERDWNVGLIVGPSGSGKSVIARELFSDRVDIDLTWSAESVIDNFPKKFDLQTITQACSAVGFNTIPSWLKPFYVLSNGEQFRVSLARRILESEDVCVIDEFTSVVDRQVGKIASHAVQKFTRKSGRQFVAVACHNDIEEWLKPDWVIRPELQAFEWGSLRRRPNINVEICEIEKTCWESFAPFHYMNASHNNAARAFGLFIDGNLAAFTSVLHFPHPKVNDIKRFHRTVVLPDYQGLGLAFILREKVASAYKVQGFRLRSYPAHIGFIKSHQRSKVWKQTHEAKQISPRSKTSKVRSPARLQGKMFLSSRNNAVFEYRGPACVEAASIL
jgi:ABC-type lipoprotein export system ATPase subunit